MATDFTSWRELVPFIVFVSICVDRSQKDNILFKRLVVFIILQSLKRWFVLADEPTCPGVHPVDPLLFEGTAVSRLVLFPRRLAEVEVRLSPVGLVSRDDPKAAHQFRNVPEEFAFGNRGTIWIPWFPNGRLGKIVPPLFGGTSFPSGSFAIGKRVLTILRVLL